MASIIIKTMWDGCFVEVENVDMEVITNQDVINSLIEFRFLVLEGNTDAGRCYTILDKNGYKIYPYEIKTLSELGFIDGDELKIITLHYV